MPQSVGRDVEFSRSDVSRVVTDQGQNVYVRVRAGRVPSVATVEHQALDRPHEGLDLRQEEIRAKGIDGRTPNPTHHSDLRTRDTAAQYPRVPVSADKARSSHIVLNVGGSLDPATCVRLSPHRQGGNTALAVAQDPASASLPVDLTLGKWARLSGRSDANVVRSWLSRTICRSILVNILSSAVW